MEFVIRKTKLPKAYKEVEYIGADGTQFINTGIPGSNIKRFVVKGYCRARDDTNAQLIGGQGNDTSAYCFYGARMKNGIAAFQSRSNAVTSAAVPASR